MRTIRNLIFNLSPKKIALYLILGPVLLFFAHTVLSISLRVISETATINKISVNLLFGGLYLLFAIPILIWLFWLRTTVLSVSETLQGLQRKWFQLAYVCLWIFVLFNVGASIMEYRFESNTWIAEHRYLIYASREFINFGGIVIAYPIVCHYAARSAIARKSDKQATFGNSLAYSLLLIFGITLCIPYLHRYFSIKTSTNKQMLIIYALALGLCALLFIIGLIAALTGAI